MTDFPHKCRMCWWSEIGRCFNPGLGPIPTKTKQKHSGKGTWEKRVGHEINDFLLRLCRTGRHFSVRPTKPKPYQPNRIVSLLRNASNGSSQ